MPRLSVIIPVYNAAPYLQACIDSLLDQRFSDFEVLLIDDGSTDESGVICDEFARKDPRVIALHQKNGGACAARNRGIEYAQGEFIVFVDADDLVTYDYLQHLMESDADMVVAGLKMFGAKTKIAVPTRRDDFGIDGLATHWNTPPNMNYLYCYPVAKRFRTRIIHDYCIRFDESVFFSEDTCFNIRYYFHADSFTELPYADYLYRITEITRDEKYKMSAVELIRHHDCLESCFNILYTRIGEGALSFVQDNTYWRMIRKLYSFLMQEGISQNVFVQNVKLFREQDWSGYMVSLLKGKKQKRVMSEAVRFPLLTYWVEVRLQKSVRKVSSRMSRRL